MEPGWTSVPIIILYKEDTPGPKAIIMIPNDYGPSEAKGSTFHETIHFLGVYTGGDTLLYDEKLVDDIVDYYVRDDKHALFEHRWLIYSLTPKIKTATTVVYLTMGFISGILMGHGRFDITIIIWIGYIVCYKLFKRIKRKSIICNDNGYKYGY